MAEVRLRVENLLSYGQAAKILGLSRPAIYWIVSKGELRSIEIGGRRYVMKEEVERLTNERAAADKTAAQYKG